jgi:hypothetical protein
MKRQSFCTAFSLPAAGEKFSPWDKESIKKRNSNIKIFVKSVSLQ